MKVESSKVLSHIKSAYNCHKNLIQTDTGKGCSLKHLGCCKTLLMLSFDLGLISMTDFQEQNDQLDHFYNNYRIINN